MHANWKDCLQLLIVLDRHAVATPIMRTKAPFALRVMPACSVSPRSPRVQSFHGADTFQSPFRRLRRRQPPLGRRAETTADRI